ncbi:MAG: TraR/DksA C4-type zinc finger protein [Methylococcales bacterium]|nr:TraR/DksA C4-type zinc finger protein [Methylococcales bacterium]
MSTAWAGGTDAIIERMEQMTSLFVEETRKSMYKGESATHCEECGEEIPESRRLAITL